MKYILLIGLFLVSLETEAQSRIGSIVDFPAVQPSVDGFKSHASIQPAIRLSAPNDSLTSTTLHHQLENCVRKNTLVPLVDSYFTVDTAIHYRAAIGFTVEKTLGKFYNRTSYSGGWSTREGIDQSHTAFLPLHNRSQYWYNEIRTRFGFTPNKIIHLSAGIDNQFFGNGYRSLIQSDQVAPAPFAMARVHFWRFEYGLLYQFFQEQRTNHREWKFNATHYLSFNATKNWNITLLETVFFQPKDSSFKRGFEVEYLNPIVFFRPQEYSIGSSDNVLLGLQSSVRVKKQTLYFQLSLDEFVLAEIRARSKWWANKYGVQLGIRGQFKKLDYILEGNLVRPYTYAHINDGQNVGNLGRSIGHPLGSNFAELLAVVKWKVRTFGLKSFASFQLKGMDEPGISWGGNVFQSYVSRPKEYGHTIGQGITVRTIEIGQQVAHKVPFLDSEIYLSGRASYSWGEIKSVIFTSISVGIRTSIFNQRRLF